MGTVTLKISAAALIALSLWPSRALAGQPSP